MMPAAASPITVSLPFCSSGWPPMIDVRPDDRAQRGDHRDGEHRDEELVAELLGPRLALAAARSRGRDAAARAAGHAARPARTRPVRVAVQVGALDVTVLRRRGRSPLRREPPGAGQHGDHDDRQTRAARPARSWPPRRSCRGSRGPSRPQNSAARQALRVAAVAGDEHADAEEEQPHQPVEPLDLDHRATSRVGLGCRPSPGAATRSIEQAAGAVDQQRDDRGRDRPERDLQRGRACSRTWCRRTR